MTREFQIVLYGLKMQDRSKFNQFQIAAFTFSSSFKGSASPPSPPLGKQNEPDSLLAAKDLLYNFSTRQIVQLLALYKCELGILFLYRRETVDG